MINIINGLLMELNNLGKVFFNYAADIFIQTAILVSVLFIIDLLLRKRTRAIVRYCIWLLVLVKLILPPTLSLPTSIAYWTPNRAHVEVPILEHRAPVVGFEQETQETFSNLQPSDMLAPPANPAESDSVIEPIPVSLIPITWQATVLLFWLVGMLAFVAILVQRVRFVRGLVAVSLPAEGQLLMQLEECRLHMRLRRKVTLRTSDALSSPAVCGLLRPTILMPASLVSKLPADGLKAAMIHELAHIKRADLWISAVQTFLQVVYFYNPFVWFANTMISRTCEEAVDETVLVTLGGQIRDYSNTLIKISEMALWKADFGLRLVGVAESRKALKRRIKNMLTQPIPKSAKIGAFGTIAIVVIAAVLLPMAKAERSNQPVIGGAGEMAPAMTVGDEIIDPNTGIKFVLAKTFSGPNNVIPHVNKLILSPDARFLVMWSKVIPLDGTEPFSHNNEHSGDNRETAVSPNGRYIVRGEKAIWLQPVSQETLRPDGPAKKILDLEGGRLVGAGNRRKSLFWTRDSQTFFFSADDTEGTRKNYAFSAATGLPVSYPDATLRGLLSPDEKYVALTDAFSPIRVNPIGDGPTLRLGEPGSTPVCWSNDGHWLIGTYPLGGFRFVSFPEGQEYSINLPDGLWEDYTTLCVGPSADRSKLLFYQASFKLTYGTMIASAEGTALKHVSDTWYNNIRWSPDGEALFHTQSGEYNLVMNPISGDKPVEFSLKPTIPDGASSLSLAPDCKYLLFTSKQQSDSNTLDLSVLPLSITEHEASGPVTVLFRIAELENLAWSPDSTRAAFIGKADSSNEEDIWVVFMDGKTPIRLTRTAAIESDLKWSPDGSTLAFLSDNVDTVELKVIPTIGGETTVIRKWNDADVPVLGWGWSPDSKSLTIAEDSTLVRQPLYGDKGEPIANLREYGIEKVSWLDWSPDGSRLAMACPRQNKVPSDSWGQLLFLRVEGNRLQKTGATDIDPATWTGTYIWSTDSTRVVFRDEGLAAVRPEGRLYEVAVEDILERIKGGAIQPVQPTDPLHRAAASGDIEKVKQLISEGADVNAMNYYGRIPLHDAASSGKTDVIEALITHGGDVNAKNSSGGTPLNVASQRESKDVVELLIDRGANINDKNNGGMTPLHQASSKGLKDIVELLIEKGANVNVKDNAGQTPLDLAKQRGHTEIVEFLKNHGAEE